MYACTSFKIFIILLNCIL